MQEAAIYAEHIVDIGRRTAVERLAHFLLEIHSRMLAVSLAQETSFNLPISQEVMADLLGLSVPHLNRVLQQLRRDKLISSRGRLFEFSNIQSVQSFAHYQPLILTQIPIPTKWS